MTRQTLALARLVVRHWARASLPSRLRRDRARRATSGLFRIGYFLMMSAWGGAVGHLVGQATEHAQRVRGTAFIVVGLVGLALVWSAFTRGPSLRGESSPLDTPFLEILPLRDGARLAVGVLERLFVYALGCAALVGVAAHAPVRALGIALALSTTGVLVGEASMRIARVVLPPLTIARARMYLVVLGQVVCLMAVVQAPSLARSPRIGVLVRGWPSTVASAVLTGERSFAVLGACAACVGLALAVISLAERIGYDRIELVPNRSYRRSKPLMLVVERIDDVLRRREPGGRWATLVMAGYTLVVSAGLVAFSWKARGGGDDAAAMIRGVTGLAGFGAFVVVNARASRMATRDVAARPLLAPLPIEPRALLAGKVVRLRRDALVVVLPAIVMLATPWSLALHLETAWRLAALLVAVVFLAQAAASIAFLTVGAGNRKGPGGSFVVESVLVLVPLVGIVTAPYWWSVVVPLAALGLVAREATASALGIVRWLDDADDFERETPIWRALLALAAFQSTEVVMERLASLRDEGEAVQRVVTLVVSALVLAVLTLQGRRDAPSLRVRTSPGWLLAGVGAGLLSGGFAAGYALVLRRLGAYPAPPLAVSLVSLAVLPLATEPFFRGWLLRCIEDALQRPVIAAVVTAFAFAAAQPPLGFGPAFALGLATGLVAVRSRSIGPAIAAHVVHAVIVTWVDHPL